MFYVFFLLNKLGLGRSTRLGGGEGLRDGLVYAIWIHNEISILYKYMYMLSALALDCIYIGSKITRAKMHVILF